MPAPESSQPPDRLRRALLLGVPAALAGCALPRRPPPPPPRGVPAFSSSRPGLVPEGWENLVLRHDLPTTDYRVADYQGRRVLRADSDGGASGLRCRVSADAPPPAWLRWEWCTREVPSGMSVARNETDDSPARVVVAFGGDMGRLSVRDRSFFELVGLLTGERMHYATLMYVWDAQLPVESLVSYARSSRVRYLVVESGARRAGQWIGYERNIADDFRRAFGEDPGPVESVGLMTDSDDLRVPLQTWYGDIRLDAA